MQRERMFELLKAAEFERIDQCCPGVDLKFCSSDKWQGSMDALFAVVGREFKSELSTAEKMLMEDFPLSCGSADGGFRSNSPMIGQFHDGIHGKYVYALNKDGIAGWCLLVEQGVPRAVGCQCSCRTW